MENAFSCPVQPRAGLLGMAMARLPTIRTSYARDAAEMTRLAEAIERDTAASVEWKHDVMGRLYEIADLLRRETMSRIASVSDE